MHKYHKKNCRNSNKVLKKSLFSTKKGKMKPKRNRRLSPLPFFPEV